MRVVWTPEAQQDRADVWDYIAADNPRAAARELAYNDALRVLLPAFVSPNEVQCPGGACRFIDGTQLLFRDDHHLSEAGARLFLEQLKPLLPFS